MNGKVVGIGGAKASAVPKDPADASKETRQYHLIPWSGNLDEAEIARPGGLLLAALIRCANDRRLQLNDMARELGVTYGYINQLRNGLRRIDQVSDDFAQGCANFLGIPRLTVLMLANRVTPKDLFESRDMMATEVGRAMEFICKDPKWGHLITPELRKCEIDSQYAIVRLFETATGKVLMDRHLNEETLHGEIKKLQEIQAARIASMETAAARKTRDPS